MTWQVLILIHAFIGAFMTLQSRALARTKKARHASMAVNAVAFSALFVVGALFVLLIGPINWDQAGRYWYVMAAAAACFALASIYMYRALAYMESAVVSVVMTSSALFTIILAGLILDESLSLIQLGGAGLLIPCIWYVLVLASREKQGLKIIRSLPLLRGFSHALLASILFATGLVFEKYSLDHVTAATYIGVGFGFQMLTAWALVLLFRRSTLKVLKDGSITMQAIRLGVIRSLAGIAFLFALIRSDNVSLVGVVANFRIIIVTILAAVLLKERDHLHQKLLAAALAFVALSIIFWN